MLESPVEHPYQYLRMSQFLHLNKQVIPYDQDDLQQGYLQPKIYRKKLRGIEVFNNEIKL